MKATPDRPGRRRLSVSIPNSRRAAVCVPNRLAAALVIAVTLLVYNVALWHKDWPPSEDAAAEENWWVSANVTRASRVMLVVAHPDDECLFFSPTLLNLFGPRPSPSPPPLSPPSTPPPYIQVPQAPRGHILSLSSGNAEGLGTLRARELRASCWSFGISSERCIVLDHSALPDSMSVWWNEDKIEELVRVYIEKWKIDMIITFDHYGVSGHANHRAVAAALTRAVHKDSSFPLTLTLLSTSILPKYLSLFTLPWSLLRHHHDRVDPLSRLPKPVPSYRAAAAAHLSGQAAAARGSAKGLNPTTTTTAAASSLLSPSSSAGPGSPPPPRNATAAAHPLSTHRSLFLSSFGQYLSGRKAFAQHRSQGRWFRALWLLTSRYMWWNELERVVPVRSRIDEPPLPPSTPAPLGAPPPRDES